MLITPARAAPGECQYVDHPNHGRILFDPFIVFFDHDSAEIAPSAAAILDNAATAWRDFPAAARCAMVVTGHADRAGSSAYNLSLSRRRAASVVAYLRQRGLTGFRFVLEPYGETRPLVETADGVDEPQNRRSEILIGPLRAP